MRRGLLCLGLALAGCVPSKAPRVEQPPVILISIDTLRADRLGVYGYAGVETPAIDALRREAVLYQDTFSPYPLTLPAHASMLTGQLPTEHGVRDNAGYILDSLTPYVPRELQAAGYETAAMVSSVVLRSQSGLGDGFDVFDDDMGRVGGVTPMGAQRSGFETGRLAIDWLRARDSSSESAPFLFLHLYEPHSPYQPPEPFASRYEDAYDGEIATADAIVGSVMAQIRDLGLYERSLIILVSDHGEGLSDHGEQEHGILLHREALRVPLLVKLPHGAHAGTTMASPVSLTIVASIVRSLTGVSEEDDSLFTDGPGTPVYSETYYPRLQLGWSALTSLVEDQWHYIGGPAPSLYDMSKDPGELDNKLASSPAVVRRLHRQLQALEQPLELPQQPTDPKSVAQLRQLGYLVGGTSTESKIDPKTALPAFGLLSEAAGLLTSGEAQAASSILEALVRSNPEMPAGWETLGLALVQLGRNEDALAAFDRARQAGGGQSSALAAAQVLMHLGRLEEARALATTALETEPVRSRCVLAEVALANKQPYQGGKLAQEAAALAPPDDPRPKLLMVRAALLLGSADVAHQEIESLEELPEDWLGPEQRIQITVLKGELAAVRGDYETAETAFRRALEARPSDVETYARLARLLVVTSRGSEAIAELNQMLTANPTPAAYQRAIALLTELRNPTQAAQLMEMARALFPGSSAFRE